MITLNVNGSNAPIKRQMDKEVARAHTHTHSGILLGHKSESYHLWQQGWN